MSIIFRDPGHMFYENEFLVGPSGSIGQIPIGWVLLGKPTSAPAYPQAQVYEDYVAGEPGLVLVWQPINAQLRSYARLKTRQQLLKGWS